MVNTYFSNRIYCDCKFRELIELVCEFLIEERYVVSSKDPNRDYEYLTRPNLDICSGDVKRGIFPQWDIIASPYRAIAEDSGEILFRVIHMRWAEEKQLLVYNNYPLNLRQEFKLCPNYIEIETHRKWSGLQIDVSNQIRDWINNKGIKASIRSFNDDFLDVINSAYETEDEKFKEIKGLVKSRFNSSELDELEIELLPSNFVLIVPELHEDSIESIRTAEFIYSIRSKLPDCSIGIMGYGKALEIELKNKLLIPLKNYWIKRYKLNPKSSPKSLYKLYEYLFNSHKSSLELGTVSYIINAALNPENKNDDVAISLCQHLDFFPNPLWMKTTFVVELTKFAKLYRNPAAHDSIMTKKELEECRELVIGSNGIIINLLK